MSVNPVIYFSPLLMLLLWSSTILGNNKLRFRQFNTKEGFPTKDVNITRQGPEGFMWFGTYDGVIKFDGTDFREYTHNVNDPNSIPDNNVSDIFVDSEGDIFVGGSGFFSRYNKETEDFSTVETDALDGTFVNAVVESKEGDYFLATYKGVNTYDKKKHQITPMKIQVPVWDMYIQDTIIFLGTQYNGLILLSTKTKEVIKSINTENNPVFSASTSIIINFEEDSKGNIWFSGSVGGLYSYNVTTDSLIKYDVYLNDEITTQNPHSIYIDSEDKVWIAFINNGLVIFDPKHKEWSHISKDNPEKLSITSNSIRDIYEDKNGTIWLSTHFGGVCYYNNSDKAVDYHYKQNSNPQSLQHEIISAFCEDKNGNLWVASDGGGLFLKTGYDNYQQFGEEKGLNSNAITAITTDAEGDIWIAEWMGGVQQFSPKTKTFEKSFLYDSKVTLNRGSEVKGVYCDSQNRIWMFSHYIPITILDKKTGTVYSSENPGLFPPALFELNYCITAIEDQDDNIWIATADGLFRYSDKYTVKRYQNIPGDSSSFIANAVHSVYCDSKNRVWVTTPDGLELYNKENDSFIHVSDKYDFPEVFYGMIEDKTGKIWFSSQEGIGHFEPETMEIKFFDRNISVTGEDFVSRSQFQTKNGDILFGSTSGYIQINPEKLKPDTTTFPIAITELQLFNKPVNYRTPNSILKKSLLNTDSITLSHWHYVVSFKYSALYYIARKKINYAYKLTGFDRDWNYVGNEQKATYTNLPPGEYTFVVKAENIEGKWSNEKQLHLTVLPPWWNTWWFRTFYISFFLILTSSILMNRINHQKKLNRTLAKLVKERTNELSIANADLASKNEELHAQNETIDYQRNQLDELNKTKDKFFSIIAHDLKNPMHTLLGFTDLLLSRYESLPEEKKIQFIEAISRSSKHLFALMVNLLDWARSQAKTINIEPEKLKLHTLVNETIAPLSGKANSKSISVQTSISEDIYVFADKNMLETVIRNILSNALKFTPENGMINLTSTETEHNVLLKVIDTGLGMSQDKIETLFKVGENRSTEGTNNEGGTGLGLILCKEFIEQNNGSIKASSIINKGSTFTITIPLYIADLHNNNTDVRI